MRYVVLHHTGIEHPHFDLMLELSPGSELSTWRLPHWPPLPGDKFTALSKHRREYLEYEGPVSRNRGQVKRIVCGVYRVIETAATKLIIAIEDNKTLSLPL
jgi:hypothetical protein